MNESWHTRMSHVKYEWVTSQYTFQTQVVGHLTDDDFVAFFLRFASLKSSTTYNNSPISLNKSPLFNKTLYLCKRALSLQKSPICCFQKSPVSFQKSSICCVQVSSVSFQKRPTSLTTCPTDCLSKQPYLCKRSLYVVFKRALYLFKRALHLWRLVVRSASQKNLISFKKSPTSFKKSLISLRKNPISFQQSPVSL